MDLQLLRSFLALADDGSFTRAAARQHLSQPAFSRRIRSLEHWVGAELVDRSTYPVTLTHAGQQLRRRAAELLEGLQEVRDEARGHRQVPPGAVRVVTSHPLAFSFFPQWWLRASEGSANSCRLIVSNTLDAYDTLAAGACDLLLTYIDPGHPLELDPDEFEYVIVGTDLLAPYALSVEGKPKFRLPGTARGPVPLLDYGAGTFFGRMVDSVLRKYARESHIETSIVTEISAGLLQLVREGMGVAWLPGLLVRGVKDELAYAGGKRWRRGLDIRVYRPRESAESNSSADRIWRQLVQLPNPAEMTKR
ncbi:MAG: LysR family transcriptional regulator [Pseudonocardiaceae bacterium]|nr:LysR family transcriptional regulator [Pseudonocardiaceae bacterium]